MQAMLEICGKRGLAKEARVVFRHMAASNVQADAVAYSWHVQAVAAGGVDPVLKHGAPKHRSLLFDQPLEMGRLEVVLGAICRKWCGPRPPPPPFVPHPRGLHGEAVAVRIGAYGPSRRVAQPDEEGRGGMHGAGAL